MMGCFLAGVREFHSVQTGLSPHNFLFSGYQQHLARGKLFQGVKLTPCHPYSGSVKMCCADSFASAHFIWSGKLILNLSFTVGC
jgi:hypothetical protein